MLRIFSVLCFATVSHNVFGQCLPVTENSTLPADLRGLQIARIELVRNDIFDVTQPDTLWFHRFANEYHVITTEATIRDDLLFTEGDQIDLATLAETERLLRSRRYLRQAEIEITHYCADTQQVVVEVRTWDNWSLLPKISLGHEGGETKSNLGFAEDNFLGSGNQLQAEYFADSERQGYQVQFFSPNIGGSYWQTALRYADNSDGESYLLQLTKPFYRLSSEWAFNFELHKDIKDISEYELGETYNEFRSNRDYLEVSGGWKINQHDQWVQHVNLGVTLDDVNFARNAQTQLPPPTDRNLSQVWLSWDMFESDYRKLTNFFQFNRVEDINFGWQATIRLGRLQPGFDADRTGWQLQGSIQKNWQLQPNRWLTFRSSFQQLSTKQHPTQALFSSHIRHIYHLNDHQVILSQLQWHQGKQLFRDQRITIGGDDGMRAFPLYYQTGNKAAIASTEYRYITTWNFYQLLDVALAGFVDAGRAWDNPDRLQPLDDGVLYGYGVGLRLLPSHASRGSIISIDLSRPVTDNPAISGWQWRLIAKREF